jgi:hypothetical protein
VLPLEAGPSEYAGHPRSASSYGIVFREARERGIPIRYPVEKKGRHVPSTAKQWLQSFTIDGSQLAPKAN